MPIIQSYEIHRGRQSEMDKTGTGTATITMIDTNGSLDPAVGTSYDPMTPVAIALTNPVTGAGSPIFTGHVARWGYDLYPTEKYGIATLECVDAMDVFANAEMYPGPLGDSFGDPPPLSSLGNIYFKEGQVKSRIDDILDDLGWPAGNREIFTGNIRLQSTTYAPGQPAINAITDAADAEFPTVANFYMQKNGFATFHGRLARFNPTDPQYGITTWRAGDIAAYNADTTRAVIFDLDYDRDKDRIVNSALCTPEGNLTPSELEAQRYQDAASIAQYGIRSWSAENLAVLEGKLTGNSGINEARLYARYMVDNFKQPRTRVSRITLKTTPPGHAWAPNIWALMTGVDISDRIQLKTTHHNGAGGFDEYYYVEGLHYAAKPATDDYLDVTLDLDLSPAAYWNTLPS